MNAVTKSHGLVKAVLMESSALFAITAGLYPMHEQYLDRVQVIQIPWEDTDVSSSLKGGPQQVYFHSTLHQLCLTEFMIDDAK